MYCMHLHFRNLQTSQRTFDSLITSPGHLTFLAAFWNAQNKDFRLRNDHFKLNHSSRPA